MCVSRELTWSSRWTTVPSARWDAWEVTSLNFDFGAPQTGHLSGAPPPCVWPQTSQNLLEFGRQILPRLKVLPKAWRAAAVK